MRHYRLCSQVYVESFDDEAIFFAADNQLMVTVNQEAAELYELFRCDRGQQPFTRDECSAFLIDNYELSAEQADAEVSSLLCFGLRKRIILKGILN